VDALSDSPLRRSAAILRFWLVDFFFSREWDRHRRALLLRHYWAYFRNPQIPSEHLPEACEPGAEQERFSEAFAARIGAVHGSSRPGQGVFLTYRPLGKNLRLLGTAVAKHTVRGERVFVREGGAPTEVRALTDRGHGWSPWLWVRPVDDGSPALGSAAHAWNQLFVNPPAAPSGPAPTSLPELPRLQRGSGSFAPRDLERVLQVAAATRYVFSPTPDVMAQIRTLKASVDWPTSEPVLGIHVRRGDAASPEAADEEPGRATRKSFGLTAYLEAADEICEKYGIRTIFLATESREEIENAARLRPQYRVLWLDYDRSIFPDIRTSGQFIEDLALEHPDRARALANTAILDLYFFTECHAFVGAFNSEFSVLAWLLTVGSRGRLVPYRSLSRADASKHVNPFRALLNIKNNCPLELYHW
jgi:hypothetical protein